MDDVDPAAAEAALAKGERSLRGDVEPDLTGLARSFALRALGVSLLAGLAVGAMWPRRQRRARVNMALATLGSMATIGLLLGSTAATFSPDAFADARYEGSLEHAPGVLKAVRGAVDDYGNVRDRIGAVSDRVEGLYALAGTEQVVASEGETVLLHVSDIHLNPLGLEVAAELASSFAVDAILDTGDITSFGWTQEAQFGSLVGDVASRTGVPYLLVPGNHDSPYVRQAMEDVPGVRVLDGEVVEVGGVRILGLGDPRFTADNKLSKAAGEELLAEQRPELASLALRTQPDLVAVHDPVQAQAVVGLVGAVAAGHHHDFELSEEEGTVLTVVGSTGATGVGSFLTDQELPIQAQLLRFSGGRLVAVDRIELQGVGGSFRIERHMISEPPTTPSDPTDLAATGSGTPG